MNVANLELCKELYELSGWDDCEHIHVENVGPFGDEEDTPAYDLGYLLRKLPPSVKLPKTQWRRHEKSGRLHLYPGRKSPWTCAYITTDAIRERLFTSTADTPENALCKLAIELFKQGILSKEKNRWAEYIKPTTAPYFSGVQAVTKRIR